MIQKGLVAAALLALAVGISHAQPQTSTRYSHAELQTLIHEAHTPQQYQTLASYFRSQQQSMVQQAQAEKAEWDRRSQITTGIYQKYPRPADSSRNRYEYFASQADQMGLQAAHYDSLSEGVPQSGVK